MLFILVVESEQNEHSPTQRYFLSVNGTLHKKYQNQQSFEFISGKSVKGNKAEHKI